MSNRQKSNMERIQRTKGAKSWAKNWQNTKGGFNPDVFKDLDEGTRQRLSDYQVGPANIKGDKGMGVGQAFTVGHWSDGEHGSATWSSNLKYGENPGRVHNHGNVQQAVWETGISNIGNKDQLNQFLDRADSVKAKHGDFLKDGWTPEAIMLMREQPQQAPAPAPKAEPVAKKPETNSGPVTQSSHLAEARERADNFKNPSSSEAFNPTAQNPDSFDKRPTESRLAQNYDFTGGASNLMSNVISNKPPTKTSPKPESPTSSTSTESKSPYKKPFTDMTNLPSTPTSGFIK